jgi:adenylosuccinate synthase
MQGLADARIAPRHLARTYMAIRTFPIRVGNVDGHSSGTWYHDQSEVTWDELRREPEITTVTKRIRRVATFSPSQFVEACHANDPDFVFVSHMDYLDAEGQVEFIEALALASAPLNKSFDLILGHGPKVEDIAIQADWDD